MIISCSGCQTRYRLDDARVPRRRIRVRCPRCASVFPLDGTQSAQVAPGDDSLVIERTGTGVFGEKRREATPAATAPRTPEPAVEQPAAGEAAASARQAASVGPTVQPSPTFERVAARPADAAAAVIVEPSPETGSAVESEGRSRRERPDKARRLARALVSDILVYNREARDRALQNGNLIEALGPEIKKSWELYKERVTPEVANSTSHFRDALNDILAEGQKVF